MSKFDQPILVLPLTKAWSEEARAAAAEARKGQGSGEYSVRTGPLAGMRVINSSPTETSIGDTMEVNGRMSAPKTEGISLSKEERPIDYGHVHEIMTEKYGRTRGDNSYHKLIDHPGANSGLHFVVGQKIQKEKRAMMNVLGKVGPLSNHHYQGLYHEWKKSGEDTRAFGGTKGLPTNG